MVRSSVTNKAHLVGTPIDTQSRAHLLKPEELDARNGPIGEVDVGGWVQCDGLGVLVDGICMLACTQEWSACTCLKEVLYNPALCTSAVCVPA